MNENLAHIAGVDPFELLGEALKLDTELTKAQDGANLVLALIGVLNRAKQTLGIVRNGGLAPERSVYLRLTAGALYCDAATRLALLKQDSQEGSLFMSLALDAAQEVLETASVSRPTHGSQRALKRLLDVLLCAAITAEDSVTTPIGGLLKRCADLIDTAFSSIKACDEISLDALNSGIFLEEAIGDFTNPSDKVQIIQAVQSAYLNAFYGFGQVQNAFFSRQAIERFSRLEGLKETAEAEAAKLCAEEQTQKAPVLVPEPVLRWHYAVAGRTLGPVDESELRERLACGDLPRDTLVWNPELPDWRTATAAELVVSPAPTPVLPAPLPASPSPNCSRCHQALEHGMKFCSGCGAPVVAAAAAVAPVLRCCPRCAAPLDPDARFCVGCGIPLG